MNATKRTSAPSPSLPHVRFSTCERSSRRTFLGPAGQWHWPVLILCTLFSAFFFAMLLGGCVFPGTKPAQPEREGASLQPVSPEEDALVRLRMAMILNQVKRQAYPALFNDWMATSTHPASQQAQQRRLFMHTHYCAERFLGPLKGYDQSSMVILRKPDTSVSSVSSVAAKASSPTVGRVSTLQVRVVTSRQQASEVDELYTLAQQDLTYRITGYYIKTRRPGFHDCMARIVFPAPLKAASPPTA
jgi:hypothetical protein